MHRLHSNAQSLQSALMVDHLGRAPYAASDLVHIEFMAFNCLAQQAQTCWCLHQTTAKPLRLMLASCR